MQFYFAPMEGVTGYIYRNAHAAFFNHIDKYFSPFIVASQRGKYKSKEIKDILPENNRGITLIPQLLTNNSLDFNQTAKMIQELGYEEINLNLGCPSGTVVAKGKGSGFLAKPEALDRFLEEIFEEANIKISIKTRIGKDDPEEFFSLIEIFNKYPLKELIIHPRIQKEFYKNKPNMAMFEEAIKRSKNPLCYNGDIHSVRDYKEFVEHYPMIDTVMLGRGLITNPGFIDELMGNEGMDKEKLRTFHDAILREYQGVLSGDRNVLFKMKELWFYMVLMFTNAEKCGKRIRKAEKLKDYEDAVNRLFLEEEFITRGE